MRMNTKKTWVAHSMLRFSCELCGNEFSNKNKLRVHIEEEHLGVRFECQICDDDFSNENQLKRHRRFVHSKLKVNCELCGKFFSSSSKLLRHNNTIHTGIKFPCELCEKIYSRKDDLKAHVSASHLGLHYICDLCGKKFTKKYKLKEHVNSEHTGSKIDRKYTLEPTREFTLESECESIERKKQKRINNANTRSQSSGLRMPMVCELCGKNFKSEKYLRMHRRSKHHAELRFECQLCGANFGKNDTLLKHTQSAHIIELTFTCEFCKNEFCQKEMLKVHKMTCFSENSDAGSSNGLKVTDFGWCNCKFCVSRMTEPRKFNICLKKLNIVPTDKTIPNEMENMEFPRNVFEFNESVLLLEINSEETEDPELQDADFKTKPNESDSSNFKNYLISAEPNSNGDLPNSDEKNEERSPKRSEENGIKIFPCTKCERKYMENKSLRRHELRAHPNDKSPNCQLKNEKENPKTCKENRIQIFPCSKCDKRYTEKKSLKRHELRVHLGIKFQCEHCDKVYLYKSQLWRHTQNKHLGVRFACQFCGKLFARKDHLKFHANTVHQQTVT